MISNKNHIITQKPSKVQKPKKKWFGFGSPRSSSIRPTASSLTSTPPLFSTPQPLSRRSALQPLNLGSSSTSNVLLLAGHNVSASGGTTASTDSPILSNVEVHDDYIGHSPLNMNNQQTIPSMTAPIGSLPQTRPQRRETVDIAPGTEVATPQWGQSEIGTSSLIGMERNEMEFKIKNSSNNKLRNYIRDLFNQY